MNKLGEVFQVSIFGESHGESIGLMITGIAPGLSLDLQSIKEDLTKRRPSLKSETPRKEADDFKIVSGYFKGFTTGGPLVIMIDNNDVQSKSYDLLKESYRPSHADYPADVHYLGYNDYRGGGSFSGRLTAPLVIAGSIAKSILKQFDITIKTHIKQVKDIKDSDYDLKTIKDQFNLIENNTLDMIDKEKQDEVLNLINSVKDQRDSIGAKIETIVLNVDAGLGEPFFNKCDSVLARNIMSIPAIKGVSFGDGFDYSDHLGSEVLDEYYFEDGVIKTYHNHNGGIVGGLTTGMPIIINSVVKPTSTISQNVRSINKVTKENIELLVNGRHDSSIFTRIPIVVDSMVAIALVDLYSQRYGYMIQRGEK